MYYSYFFNFNIIHKLTFCNRPDNIFRRLRYVFKCSKMHKKHYIRVYKNSESYRFNLSKCQSIRCKLNSWHTRNFYGCIKNTSGALFPFEIRWTKTDGVTGGKGDAFGKRETNKEAWLGRSTSETKTR